MTDPLRLSSSLRVRELGRADGPTLLLLHGFTDSGLCWPDAVRRWAPDHRIVAPDARGHGESPRFDPATGGGNHFEEMVVAARPDLVCAAVLEDPPWFTLPRGGERSAGPDTTQQWAQGFRDDLDGAVASGRLESPLWPAVEFGPWGVSKAQLDPSLTDPEQIARPGPWTEVAAAIARPTLVVTGSRQDAVLVTAQSREGLAGLGNRHLEVAVVPGAGHTVRRDCADAYHQIVDPWIREQFAAAGS